MPITKHVEQRERKWEIINQIIITCIDKTSSALASGAGMARDSLVALLSRSGLWPLVPAAPCLTIQTKVSLSALIPTIQDFRPLWQVAEQQEKMIIAYPV